MSEPIELSDESFDSEVLKSEIPVVVDFWAPWCGPCRAIAPIMHDLAAEADGRFKVAKVNVDDCRATAGKYGILSIPTLMVFRGGKEVATMMGSGTTKPELLEALLKQ